jgi:putative membrane protein
MFFAPSSWPPITLEARGAGSVLAVPPLASLNRWFREPRKWVMQGDSDMKILRSDRRSGALLVAALVAATLGACSTSRQQPPAANAPVNVGASSAVAAQPVVKKPMTKHVVKEADTKSAGTSTAALPDVSNKSTKTILVQIHQANLKEVAIGKIAQERASSSEVRAYAAQLVEDHTSADNMVVAMARKAGARLHESAQGKLLAQKLSSISGAGFDRLFLQQTSSDHERLIRELQQEREDASDDEVEALIDKIMPILEQHRDLAQILMKKEQA